MFIFGGVILPYDRDDYTALLSFLISMSRRKDSNGHFAVGCIHERFHPYRKHYYEIIQFSSSSSSELYVNPVLDRALTDTLSLCFVVWFRQGMSTSPSNPKRNVRCSPFL